MKRKICALLTALLLLGTASAASLPEGMAYLGRVPDTGGDHGGA